MSALHRQTLPLIPRVLSREQAAAYVGLSVAAFDQRVKAGKLPTPLPADVYGRARFDRAQLDRQLDRDSGLSEKSMVSAASALREWRNREYGKH